MVLGLGVEAFGALAARALAPKAAPPEVDLEHLHTPRIDMAAELDLVRRRLQAAPTTFRKLVGEADIVVVVARFLLLLDLYREGRVVFDQVTPLGDLTIRWTAE